MISDRDHHFLIYHWLRNEWRPHFVLHKVIKYESDDERGCQEMDEKMTWNPTCLKMDIVCWSLGFGSERPQTSCLRGK